MSKRTSWIEMADDAAAQAAAASRELDILVLDNPQIDLELVAKTAINARYDARDAREDVALAEITNDRKGEIVSAVIASLNAAVSSRMLELARDTLAGKLNVELPPGCPTHLSSPPEPEDIPDEGLSSRPVLFDDGDVMLSFYLRR